MKHLKLIVVVIATVSLGATFNSNHDGEKNDPPVPSQKNQMLGNPCGYHVFVDPMGSKAPDFGWEWTINYLYVPVRWPGKVTILHFFNPDCPHCEDELPELNAFYRRNMLKVHLIAFGVGSDVDRKNLRKFKRKLDLKMSIVMQDEIDFESPLMVMGVFTPHFLGQGPDGFYGSVPVTFIIDQEGIIRFVIRNKGNWSEISLESIFVQELTDNGDKAERLLEAYLSEMKNAPADEQNDAAWTMAMSQYHLEEAKELAERAVAQDKDNPYYLGTLGIIQYLLGEYEEAEMSLKDAIVLHSDDDPKAVDTLYLGLTYFAQGDYCKAKRFLTKSLELDDSSSYAVYALGVLIDMKRRDVGFGACLHQTESKPISL